VLKIRGGEKGPERTDEWEGEKEGRPESVAARSGGRSGAWKNRERLFSPTSRWEDLVL